MTKKLLLLFVYVFPFFVFAQTKLIEKATKPEAIIPFEKYVLSNGLTLIIQEDHSDPLVSVEVKYKVGSARENPDQGGFAHFFEHMLFMGSEHVPNGEHLKRVIETGGYANGSTNRDFASYFNVAPVNELEKLLWLESDRMGYFINAITKEKFESQKAAVQNEIRGVINYPYGNSETLIAKYLFPYGHPYSRRPLGTIEDVEKVTIQDLKNFYLRYYVPNNANLIVSGDVQPANVVKLVEKFFGGIPKGLLLTKINVPETFSLEKDRYVSFTEPIAKQPRLYIVFPAVSNHNKDAEAFSCFWNVFANGSNSILYNALVKTGAAQIAAAGSIYLNDLTGSASFFITPSRGKTLAQMKQLFLAALDSFELKITDEDISAYKGSMESLKTNWLETVRVKGSVLGNNNLQNGTPKGFENEINRIHTLTKEDVIQVYRQYFKGKHALYLSMVPKGQEAMITAPDNYTIDSSSYQPDLFDYSSLKYHKPIENFDRSKMPESGPLPQLHAPVYWKTKFQNGVSMIGTTTNEVPEVLYSLTLPGGYLLQAKDLTKAGLANVFAQILNSTVTMSEEDISKELSALGASIDVNSTADGTVFTIKTLKRSLPRVTSLLQDLLLHPNITEDNLAIVKQKIVESIKESKSNPVQLADRVFPIINYGTDNVLGIGQVGTETTVQNITLEDVKTFYSNTLAANHAKLAIVGDINEKDALSLFSFLQKLPVRKLERPIVSVKQIDKTKIYLVDYPNAVQTVFRVGNPTVLRYDATGDFYKATLANYMLGSHFDSRLHTILRDKKSWTYAVLSSVVGDSYTGRFEFRSNIKGNATDSALLMLIQIFKDYTSTGLTDEEVSFLKKAVVQSEALKYESPDQKLQFIKRIQDYNLPTGFVQQQQRILQTITREELLEAIKKVLDPERINILLVGDEKKILEPLKKTGYQVVELTADGMLKQVN